MRIPRQRILAVVGALALFGATLMTGIGHEEDYVETSSVSILPGPLVAHLTWEPFAEQPGRTITKSQDGYLLLHVLDERGYPTGWNVSLAETGSLMSEGQLDNGQYALVPGAVTVIQRKPNLAGHSTFCVDPLHGVPTRVWSVSPNAGDGEYNLPLGITWGGPNDQQRQTFTTIVVNINGIAP